MKCIECDACRKGFWKSKPEAYICIGVKEPFEINDVYQQCTEYPEKREQQPNVGGLIRRQELLDSLEEPYNWCDTPEELQEVSDYKRFVSLVMAIPAVDAKPVRYGRWVKAHGMMPPEYTGRHVCSECDRFAPSDLMGREVLTAHCPNCGVKMNLEN